VLDAVRNYGATHSYSQCGEDLIVNILLLENLKRRQIAYLDVGAHHPVYLSNTYLFYQRGFNGVCVEPDAEMCIQIRKKRPRDLCLNIGIGTGNETTADFYTMSTRTLNTFSLEEARRYESYGSQKIEKVEKVSLHSMNSIIERYFRPCPNFVSLDIEGMELKILQNFDFARHRPEVFCIETLTYTEDNSEKKITEVNHLMEQNGYFVYADTYINTIFVDRMAWDQRTLPILRGLI
jgi:FkbM family methyltransferase